MYKDVGVAKQTVPVESPPIPLHNVQYKYRGMTGDYLFTLSVRPVLAADGPNQPVPRLDNSVPEARGLVWEFVVPSQVRGSVAVVRRDGPGELSVCLPGPGTYRLRVLLDPSGPAQFHDVVWEEFADGD